MEGPEEGNCFSPVCPPLASPDPAKCSPHPPFGKALSSKVPMMTRIWAIPSTHRMTTDGFLQLVGHLGAMLDPLIGMTRQALPLLPSPPHFQSCPALPPRDAGTSTT